MMTKKISFDFVLLMDVFEHISNIESFVGKLATIQKNGGVLYIITPNPIFCGPAEKSELFYTKKMSRILYNLNMFV